MGTRHLIAVQLDGGYPIAQYGQWDGYPRGQGARVLEFLRKHQDLEQFKEKCRAAVFATSEQILALYADCGHDGSEWINMNVSERFGRRWPWLSRDAGAEVLNHVLNQPGGILLKNSLSFAGDSLFCEYAYVIDLDRGVFEVYEGFNKTPLGPSERFAQVNGLESSQNEEYKAVRFRVGWALSGLPTHEEFLKVFEGQEEEA